MSDTANKNPQQNDNRPRTRKRKIEEERIKDDRIPSREQLNLLLDDEELGFRNAMRVNFSWWKDAYSEEPSGGS